MRVQNSSGKIQRPTVRPAGTITCTTRFFWSTIPSSPVRTTFRAARSSTPKTFCSSKARRWPKRT
ncbi:MAG: hypothetical protein DMF30_11220, partial [Verrucomicrobia bacterium]